MVFLTARVILPYAVKYHIYVRVNAGNRYFGNSLLDKCNYLFLVFEAVADINVFRGEVFVVFSNEQKPHNKKVNLFKYNSIIVYVFLYVFLKLFGHFRPVHAGAQVVANVVTIVKA